MWPPQKLLVFLISTLLTVTFVKKKKSSYFLQDKNGDSNRVTLPKREILYIKNFCDLFSQELQG